MRTNESEALFEFFRAVTDISQSMTVRAEHYLPNGLTMAQFELLDLLKTTDRPILPMDAAKTMRLTRGAVSNLIKQLEKKQMLVSLSNPEDGRSKHITLSAQGHKSHRDSMIALSQLTTSILKTFSSHKFAAVQNLLDELSHWLDNTSATGDSQK